MRAILESDPRPAPSALRIHLDLRSPASRTAASTDSSSILLSLVDFDTPDPFLVHAPNGRFYMTFTCGNRIDLLSAPSLAAFRTNHSRHTLWIPPPGLPYSSDIWAPEMHVVNGRWHIYFAAASASRGNASHRMYVLAGPGVNDDPALAPWHFLGPLKGMPAGQWAIDGTILCLKGILYFAYSGWPVGDFPTDDLTQHLYITRLLTPTSVSASPICISEPEHSWEFTHDARGSHGINEGPQFLESPDGKWQGLVYSCAGSWTNQYKMSTLQFIGNDPLSPSSWLKGAEPLLQSSPVRRDGPWAPGHGNFLTLGHDTIAVFHATDSPFDGWANRKARVQHVHWNLAPVQPQMGRYIGQIASDLDSFTKFLPSKGAPATPKHDFHTSSTQSVP